MIYIVSTSRNEDLVDYIAYEIASRTGTNLVLQNNKIPTSNFILIIELGGIWDRGPGDIYVDDRTRTKVFESMIKLFFNVIESIDFRTRLSEIMKERYVRIELTNKVRYSEVMREMFIRTMVEILKKLKSNLGDEFGSDKKQNRCTVSSTT